MFRSQKGFTLIELMIVVVIIGILAAIAIPNFIAMQDRAKEGSVKSNMHTLQLAAEDYGVQNDGVYSATVDDTHIYDLLPGKGGSYKNPFSGGTGIGSASTNAVEDRGSVLSACTAQPGLTSYADSSTATYNVKGYGKNKALTLVLTAGQ